MSKKPVDVLSLLKPSPTQSGETFTMGSCVFDDKGAYKAPQTIQRHGMVRAPEPANFNTGHDPHAVSFPRYEDGRVIEMPGLPAPSRRKITTPNGE